MSEMHFEELWEKCEELNNVNMSATSSCSIAEEVVALLNIYKLIGDHGSVSSKEVLEAKTRTLGEAIYLLTKLSLKDNINVFEALASAYNKKNTNIPKNLKFP